MSRFMIFVGNEWKNYGELEDKLLKHFFQAGEEQVIICMRGVDFVFDFKQLLQTNVTTGEQRSICAPTGWVLGARPNIMAFETPPPEIMGSMLATIHPHSDTEGANLLPMPLMTMPLHTICSPDFPLHAPPHVRQFSASSGTDTVSCRGVPTNTICKPLEVSSILPRGSLEQLLASVASAQSAPPHEGVAPEGDASAMDATALPTLLNRRSVFAHADMSSWSSKKKNSDSSPQELPTTTIRTEPMEIPLHTLQSEACESRASFRTSG